jgi:hypothetical protein
LSGIRTRDPSFRASEDSSRLRPRAHCGRRILHYLHTHKHTDTQTHRHTDTQTHSHTDTQTHTHTDRRIKVSKVIPVQAVEALRAHRWRQGCQPYAPAAFYPQEDFFRGCVEPRAIVRLEELGKFKKSTFSGTRTGDLPACSIVPQPTTLPRRWIQQVIIRKYA